MNSARQAEWVFGQGPNSPFVDWSAVQGLFGAAKSDVLIMLDTCAAASSATTSHRAVIETIAACGFERRAPPPGEHSLTNTLIDVLRDWINKPSFSVASLHTEILFRLKHKETKKGREGIPLEWCVTPIHWVNTRDCKASGIEICRRNVLRPLSAMPSTEADTKEALSTFIDPMDIDFDDTSSTSTPLSSTSSAGGYKVPHVLITLQLEENQPLDAGQCARWLEKFPLLAKWVKVEAVFPSYSTLMILSIPMPIWDMLPDHPACSFVGYVTAPNIGGLINPGNLYKSQGKLDEAEKMYEQALQGYKKAWGLEPTSKLDIKTTWPSSTGATPPSRTPSSDECFSCAQTGHWSSNCPRRRQGSATPSRSTSGDKCFTCGKIGHWSSNCPARRNR
jgi:hypothetical protein